MPRPPPNPAPRTAAARDALKAFYCDLCQKGYARSTEYEAHESSYDHQHKKRLKEMREMQRDPGAVARARKAERRAEEKSGGGLITIKPMRLGGGSAPDAKAQGLGSGFKKGGFKSAFGGERVKVEGEPAETKEDEVMADPGQVESDTDGEYERYDPRRPTDCDLTCAGRLD